MTNLASDDSGTYKRARKPKGGKNFPNKKETFPGATKNQKTNPSTGVKPKKRHTSLFKKGNMLGYHPGKFRYPLLSSTT